MENYNSDTSGRKRNVFKYKKTVLKEYGVTLKGPQVKFWHIICIYPIHKILYNTLFNDGYLWLKPACFPSTFQN